MSFIQTRKLKFDAEGRIVSGSAAVIDVHYVKDGKYHSKQVVREKLGKVVELYSKKRGLFQSPTRGLVVYDAEKDEFSAPLSKQETVEHISDPEISEELFPAPNVHTVFGDVYLLFEILFKTGILKLIVNSFSNKIFIERLLCHILHDILKDGSKIHCDDFILKSFAYYVIQDIQLNSLRSDTEFFTEMGNDKKKMQFFTKYISFMREENTNFGKTCFVDSTPLPNDIDSPFSALCSHGVDSSSFQMRLILVLDELTCCPIWFDIIPGNVLDINTLKPLIKDIEISLDINLSSFILDAGYASKELIQSFKIQNDNEPIPERRYLVRMPAKKGFPFKKLYLEMKQFFKRGKYNFIRRTHSYFGRSKKINFFDTDTMCYIYVDEYNALKGFTDFVSKNPNEFDKMKDKDKDWYKVKFGFFVLISNYIKSPSEILDDYFSRTNIESEFKTDKEYLKLLPLRKWTDTTVRGKIFSDIINSIVRHKMYEYIKGKTWSISSVIGKCQSLMCFRDDSENTVYTEAPNKQVKEFYKCFDIDIPQSIHMQSYIDKIYNS